MVKVRVFRENGKGVVEDLEDNYTAEQIAANVCVVCGERLGVGKMHSLVKLCPKHKYVKNFNDASTLTGKKGSEDQRYKYDLYGSGDGN